MSASVDQAVASVDKLLAQTQEQARRNGRLEIANEILQWWVAHSHRLPQDLREEFARVILKAVE